MDLEPSQYQKFVSIDIETLGLDEENCDIIEFGAVAFDASADLDNLDALPRYHAYIVKPFYKGDPYAMHMHRKILKRIADREEGYNYCNAEDLGHQFKNWCIDNGIEFDYLTNKVKLSVAGKNFANFDCRFLKKLPTFFDNVHLQSRILDPGSMYYNPRTDLRIPSLEGCLNKIGIQKTVEHTAVEDALDVIRVVKKYWDLTADLKFQ